MAAVCAQVARVYGCSTAVVKAVQMLRTKAVTPEEFAQIIDADARLHSYGDIHQVSVSENIRGA